MSEVSAATTPTPSEYRAHLLGTRVVASARDRRLVERVLRGDDGAFDELRRHIEPAVRRCLKRVLEAWPEVAGEAEDLRQALEVHLVEHDARVLRSYRGEAALDTWMHAVATRFFFRRASRWTAKGRATRSEGEVETLTAPDEGPEQTAVRAQRRARVRAALDGCSDEERILYTMVFEQGVDAVRLADALGSKPSTIRMRKKRLLEKLARHLEGLWP